MPVSVRSLYYNKFLNISPLLNLYTSERIKGESMSAQYTKTEARKNCAPS